jgi:hypothetical protein
MHVIYIGFQRGSQIQGEDQIRCVARLTKSWAWDMYVMTFDQFPAYEKVEDQGMVKRLSLDVDGGKNRMFLPGKEWWSSVN